jgi:PRC-barrel domain
VSEPVSWLLIEPGWEVVDENGEHVGKIEEVVGDSEEDIFNGLAVSRGLLDRPRYVPSERVKEITEGRIRLAFPRADLDRLGEFEEPPASLEVGSAEASAVDRVAGVFTDAESGPHPLTLWRRLLNRIFRT